MSDGLVIVPSNGDGFVELARTKQGRLFRKHILNKGNLIHPTTGKPIKIDDTFVDTLKTNFTKGVCDIVQVPLADKNNAHSEDPERNLGEVIGIEDKDDKVYALIDVRKAKAADEMGKTLLGASAMMHLDYTDTKTGKKVGPTLLHACVTNRPYVTGLDSYEEIVEETVAATSDRSGQEAVVLLTENDVVQPDQAEPDKAEPVPAEPEPTEEPDMPEEKTTSETAPKAPTLAELFETLKSEHNIDVPGLQSQVTQAGEAAKLTNALTEALANAGLVKLTKNDDTVSNEDVVGAVAELAQSKVEMTGRLAALERERAEEAVQRDIDGGYIKPAKKADMVELKLSNPSLYDAVRPDEPIVKLNNEAGRTPPEDASHTANIDADIERYVTLSRTLNGAAKK
jgi:hypothetical protein